MTQDADVLALQSMLNVAIESGTYPQDKPHDLQQFITYYCSHHVFIARHLSGPVLGAFYGDNPFRKKTPKKFAKSSVVKPNFPGRSSHICNGGFLVDINHRRQGIGRILAKAFDVIAPGCGFSAAFFNLVGKINRKIDSASDEYGIISGL